MSDKVTDEETPDPVEGEGEPGDGGESTGDSDAVASRADEAAAASAGDDDDDIAIEVEAPDDGGDGVGEVEVDPVAELEARVAALEAEKKETFDRLLRATADLDNFRKRARRDVDDARIEATKKVLSEMLPVVDNLERALAHADGADAAAASIIDGVKLVLRQFVQAFERFEVVPFESIGQPFDPNVHEAVGQIETADHPPGAVAQELQRGYRIGDRLLRAAMVVVAKAPAQPAAGDDGGAQAGNGHDKGNGSAGPAETTGGGEA
jgi:molecular chaperone GrpE